MCACIQKKWNITMVLAINEFQFHVAQYLLITMITGLTDKHVEQMI